MRRLTLSASLALVVLLPATAVAQAPTARHRGVYEYLYHHISRGFGHRAPGRNIIRDGLRGRPASDADVVRSIAVLERMLAPTPVSAAGTSAAGTSAAGTSAAGAAQTVAGSSATPSGSPLPTCTWQPESGGNPSAVNASSGAGGYYQIMPSTWAAYGGTGAPQSAPMSEQTAIAQKIYQSQGASAWSNC